MAKDTLHPVELCKLANLNCSLCMWVVLSKFCMQLGVKTRPKNVLFLRSLSGFINLLNLVIKLTLAEFSDFWQSVFACP